MALAELRNRHVKHFVGFYPGQIRHYLHLQASVPSKLIFPIEESHFDVIPVIHALKQDPLCDCDHSAYYHGFMNPKSKGFNPNGVQQYTDLLKQIVIE